MVWGNPSSEMGQVLGRTNMARCVGYLASECPRLCCGIFFTTPLVYSCQPKAKRDGKMTGAADDASVTE